MNCYQSMIIQNNFNYSSFFFFFLCYSSSHQLNDINRTFGIVIHCNLSLNEQTRIHSCDELASLFDILYCQIEQLILKQQTQTKYIFDNETLFIAGPPVAIGQATFLPSRPLS